EDEEEDDQKRRVQAPRPRQSHEVARQHDRQSAGGDEADDRGLDGNHARSRSAGVDSRVPRSRSRITRAVAAASAAPRIASRNATSTALRPLVVNSPSSTHTAAAISAGPATVPAPA